MPPGEFGTRAVAQFFCNTLDCSADPRLADLQGVRVSAHLFVSRRGAVTQFVSFDRRAWHAGVSHWRGRTGCNDFSVGIELEGTDDSGYTNRQYGVLAGILDTLIARYPRIDRSAVVGHSEIASGRKTDPGPHFDWPRIHDGLFQSLQPGSARGRASQEKSPRPAKVSLAEGSSAGDRPSREP